MSTSRPPRRVGRRAFLGAAAAALAACSGDPEAGPTSTPSTPVTPDPTFSSAAPEERALVWAAWPDYIDVDDAEGRPTLAAIQAQSGIPVDYQEVIEDNDEYIESIRPQLEAHEPVGADIVTL